MHIFHALSSNIRRDVIDDKEVLRDWDFPRIHLTVDSNSGCLEASVRMVYCATFCCNVNSSTNKVTCSWFKLPTEPTLFNKVHFKLTKHSRLCLLWEHLFWLWSGPDKVVSLGAKISLKEDDMPTLLPIVKAMLMPQIRWTSTTTAHLGSKRDVSDSNLSLNDCAVSIWSLVCVLLWIRHTIYYLIC